MKYMVVSWMNNLKKNTNPDADSKKRERTTGDI